MINTRTIDVVKTAQLCTQGSLSKSTKYIWICLHGYGQSAMQMARKMTFLGEEHFVICPEGLNKFYWHSNRQPVACWMTSDNRYAEIDNFCSYLDTLYNRYCLHVNHQTKIILFGFSQGCATLWRWIHSNHIDFDYLINWAGWIPEDISYIHMQEYLQDKKLFLVYGDNDEYLNNEVISKLEILMAQNRLNIEKKEFSGKHQIPPEELKTFIEDLGLIPVE